MKRVALLFPGQGSQYVGMGRNIYDNLIAREVFDEANETLGFDLKGLMFDGSMDELTKTQNTQPAILTFSVAAFRKYMEEFGVEPLFMAGHSLGEISALTCSGAIKFPDALKIVRKRGRFMQEAVPLGIGTMMTVSGVDMKVVEEICKHYSDSNNLVVISNYNSNEQIVVSGHSLAINKALEKLKLAGARTTLLKVSAPFHSPLMQPAADRLKEELGLYEFNDLSYDVISNVTALPYQDPESIVGNLSLQIVKPVRWAESIKYLKDNGVELVVELGPQTVLKNLMTTNAPGTIALSYDKEEDVQSLKKVFSKNRDKDSGSENNYLRLVARCLAIAVCTKNSNWDNEEYTRGVIEPYKRVQQMHEELERRGEDPTVEQMKQALNMLKSVFETKRTPLKEQTERFNQIFKETGLGYMFEDLNL